MDKLKQEQHDPKAHQLFDRSMSKLEIHTQKGKLKLIKFSMTQRSKVIYVYWPSLVRIEKNFAQGLEHTQPRSMHSRPRAKFFSMRSDQDR